ncbi:3-dehydroquinate synthase [Helicobacter sp. 12S02634-8]|uniref:3-dehydroquinate synthase n=1 Tax=Helicobacter sp. 12S02634-8 TaxID=1476199 RepID=UPI000BA4EA34|nr:3-dehydroquinate synthase [Helicobacter sp. 12S02634-8]PAF48546.1 3-dehydroquinate synthase [Helicobacter sp. 12S02634-8]
METITICTSCEQYPIYIGALQPITHRSKVLIITNPKVAGLYLPKLLANLQAQEVHISTIPDGESYKNFQSVEKILEDAFNAKLDRKSLMIALGGGVISDIVGFVSGIYQRGIDFITIPTTLLAQVDASVGGKSGINNHFGKNLVGLFHQPRAVYIDPSFLSTLPQRELGAGIAEIIKMAVCFDGEFFTWLEHHDLNTPDLLTQAISKSIHIKSQVVSLDEKEEGLRAGLNYGHTFGHVIENETKYSVFLHGEAVAIGMRMANQLAQALGYMSAEEVNRIEALLGRYGLVFDYRICDGNAFYEKFFLDKKSRGQKIKFILPKGIGGMIMLDDIPKEVIISVLKGWTKI